MSGNEGDGVESFLGLRGERNVAVRGRRGVVERRRCLLSVADTVRHAAVLAARHAVQTRSYRRDANRRPDAGQVSAVRHRVSTSVGVAVRSPVVRSRRRRFVLPLSRLGGGDGGGRLVPDRVVLLSPSLVVPRPLHQDDARQVVEEQDAYPAGHPVRPRRAEKPVDDDHREDDDDHVVDERKQQVVGDERNRIGRRRKDLGHEQQKHDERQQHRYAHGHLLAGVGRQVEHADAEERDKDARNDEVDGVEERFASDADAVVDNGDVMFAVRVLDLLNAPGTRNDVPRTARNVVAQIRLSSSCHNMLHWR